MLASHTLDTAIRYMHSLYVVCESASGVDVCCVVMGDVHLADAGRLVAVMCFNNAEKVTNHNSAKLNVYD